MMKKVSLIAGILAGLAFMVSGCLEDIQSSQDIIDRVDRALIQKYLEDNNLSADYVETESGIYYRAIIENAAGETIEPGEAVLVYYDVFILPGNPSNPVGDTLHTWHEEDGLPVPLSVGNFTLVPVGLEAGLFIMREGETYSFILPSRLGFASFSTTDLPTNAVLRMDVEVVAVHGPEEQKAYENEIILNYIDSAGVENPLLIEDGLYFKQLEPGNGRLAAEDSQMYVTYTGRFLDSTVFDSNVGDDDPFSFILGRQEVIEGWELGIAQMEEEEKGNLFIPSHLAYFNDPSRTRSVVPNYLITFLSGNRPDFLPSFEILLFEVRVDSMKSP